MRNRRGVWVAFLLVATAACGGGEQQGVAVTEEDLVYGSWAEESLTLDMHAPADSEGAPVVVYLPGQGQTDAPAWMVEPLIDEGVFLFVVRYVETGEGPERILDDKGALARAMADSVGCSLHFARDRASEFGSDDPIVLLAGFSLGGGPAVHAALFGDSLEGAWEEHETEGGPPRQVDCEIANGSTHVDTVVGFSGAYDVFTPIYDGKYGSGYQQNQDPVLWSFLSSSIGANPDLKVRLLHGDPDWIIPHENSVGLADALTDAGYDVQLVTFEGGHEVPTDLAIPTIIEAFEE